MAATGHVKFEGAWVTPAERDHAMRVREAGIEDLKRELARDIQEAEILRLRAAEGARQVEAKRVELAEREARVKVLEDQHKDLVRCGVCGGYFHGEHLCQKAWTW